MEFLTIGSFARAARLSPKALRLYDELGLLRPAAVDADSGYRYYDPAQLDHARLVSWMRRIGLPLARIREIAELPGAEAARAVTAWMSEAEAEFAARTRLAGLLVDHLTEKGTPMSDTRPILALRFAAGSTIGQVRETQQDLAYAASALLAVADGGGPGGDRAAAAAIDAFRMLPPQLPPLEALEQGIRTAEEAVRSLSDEPPFTTLTALVRSGSRIGVAHIGDSRAYLLRAGELSRFTDDHSYVQQLVDAGTLPASEALAHPQRPLLLRALGAGGEADVSLRTALPGDRYLLCTDGIWATLADLPTLLPTGTPEEAVARLLAATEAAGAPDNAACVVADAVPA